MSHHAQEPTLSKLSAGFKERMCFHVCCGYPHSREKNPINCIPCPAPSGAWIAVGQHKGCSYIATLWNAGDLEIDERKGPRAYMRAR